MQEKWFWLYYISNSFITYNYHLVWDKIHLNYDGVDQLESNFSKYLSWVTRGKKWKSFENSNQNDISKTNIFNHQKTNDSCITNIVSPLVNSQKNYENFPSTKIQTEKANTNHFSFPGNLSVLSIDLKPIIIYFITPQSCWKPKRNDYHTFNHSCSYNKYFPNNKWCYRFSTPPKIPNSFLSWNT